MNDIDLRRTETGELESALPDREPEGLFSELSEESPTELRVKLENCEKRCEDLRNKNEELHYNILEKTSIIDQKDQETRTLREELYVANARIVQLQEKVESQTHKLQECREIAERLRDQITQLKDQVQSCEEEKRVLNGEKKRLEEGIDIYRKDNHNLESEVELLIVKHKFEKEELKKEIANFKGKLEKIESILAEYKKIVDTWEEEKAYLETENEKLKAKVNRLKELFDDLFRRIQNMKDSPDVQGSKLEKSTLEIEEPQRIQETLFEQPENLSESTFQPSEKDEYPWQG